MPLYTEFITVRENKRASLERVFSHRNKLCIERHNSHTVRLKSDSHNNMLPVPIYVNSVLPCLCLWHVARRTERNVTGGENKNTILLMLWHVARWIFFYFVPVEPKPPSPLSVSSSSSTSLKSAVMYGAKTI